VDYGQLVKVKGKGCFVGKEWWVVFGELAFVEVEMVDVESFSGVLRERLGGLVRRMKCFAKTKRRLVCAVGLFQFYWSFIIEFKRDVFLARMGGLTDHVWTWHELFHFYLSFLN